MRNNIKKIVMHAGSRKMPGIEVTLGAEAAKAMRMVRRHFRILTSESINAAYETTRYDGWWDFASICVNNAMRLENHISFGGTVSIGSGYLSEIPWALFGNSSSKERAEYKFPYFESLFEHYENSLNGFNKSECKIPFQEDLVQVCRMADRYNERVEKLFGVCFLLARDLIFHAGPDSDMFFDLFTNDSRDNPETMDLDNWEANRCKLFGRFGGLKTRSTCNVQYNDEDYSVGYPYSGCFTPAVKKKFKKCEPQLEFISRNAPIFEGMAVFNSK